ncbi:bacteriohemerythrin [Candidatus Methylospira mobilis]|uniref:Bacteriohemerythrin n=1 Tax=Candidatus Methylospira mobilis TaxID=1808979 RepID=A0A5Q0BQ56_9GAMM|nr:bacteriohemerythrin [Candidatus Methylospira mobilis]QFY44217.1 bacteriohemerythrin [Candidatus Methylospira mobilis]
MALFEWDDNLVVGVLEIDDQHQRLVELINLLHDDIISPDKSGSEKITQEILEELVDYTIAHFSIEQYLMDVHEYPESPAHINEHNKFIDKISQFEKDFKEKHANIQQDTLAFLKDWLYNHIMKVDKEFGKFLNSKGVS